MPEAGGLIQNEKTRETERQVMKGLNEIDLLDFDPELVSKPEGYVYIYSVADTPSEGKGVLERRQPPLIPHLRMPGTTERNKPVLVVRIPHPFNQPDSDSDGHRVVRRHKAIEVAADIVNPANFSKNQDRVPPAAQVVCEGDDYGRLGVFWSVNNPPTKEEVQAAIRRKENHYQFLLEEARVAEIANPASLYPSADGRRGGLITPFHHLAADYFGEITSWHKVALQKPEVCENCGEEIKKGVAFHPLAAMPNVLCIRDWDKAIAAGVKKEEDRPKPTASAVDPLAL